MSKRHRQIAKAILTGKANSAVRQDTGWHDAMRPRTDPECAKHVGKRPAGGLTRRGVCEGCAAVAGTDTLGRLKPHTVAPPTFDRCPGMECGGQLFRVLYGIAAAYTAPLCDTCSGASEQATTWAHTADPWTDPWGAA